MTDNQFVPAAQYLRMSTEHQQYSLENQSLAIHAYAESHGFEVIHTYSDSAKSGMVLRYRTGLQQLLRDVVSGNSVYRAILVYDVSRWGRFQDTDESAHYEFLCKSAGVPVHYCAEQFSNDGTLPSLIMKALKRTMAGEYSREMGVKIVAGQRRLTLLGFKQGGQPGYGLRRMLVSPTGVPKQELALRERKSIATDRVILVPGPDDEVRTVKEIYRMLMSEKRSICSIARKLNKRGVPRPGQTKWDSYAVRAILTHPKYCGCAVFGQTSSRLYTPLVKLPKSEWIIRPGAFEPIIDAATFAEAQKAYARRTYGMTNEDLLNDLRVLLAREGSLSLSIIKNSPNVASDATYRNRFGSLRTSYKMIGYGYPGQFDRVDARIRTTGMREALVSQIAETFPSEVSIERRGGRWRSRLRLSGGLIVSVVVARWVRVWNETHRWLVDPVWHERKLITLVARFNKKNDSFLDYHIFPRIKRSKRFFASLNDSWFKSGEKLDNLSDFVEAVAQMRVLRRKERQAN